MLDRCSQRHAHAGQCLEKDEAEPETGKVALSSRQTRQSHRQKPSSTTQNEEERMPRGAGGRDGGRSKPGYPREVSSVVTKNGTGRKAGAFADPTVLTTITLS